MNNSALNFSAIVESNVTTLIEINDAAHKALGMWLGYFGSTVRSSLETSMEMGKKLSTIKNPAEILELQTQHVHRSVATLVEEGQKLSALTVSTVDTVSKPLARHFKGKIDLATKVPTKAAA